MFCLLFYAVNLKIVAIVGWTCVVVADVDASMDFGFGFGFYKELVKNSFAG
jgi:hypothetical protein